MNRHPALARHIVFAILYEMIAPAQSTEALVKNSLLHSDTTAKVGYMPCIYAGCFIYQIGCGRTGFAILGIKTEKFFSLIEFLIHMSVPIGITSRIL